MKNFEKYIDKLAKQICVRTITREKGNRCEECTFGLSDGSCNDEMIKQWLLEEYKKPIKLTHDEYVILKNLAFNNWLYIYRKSNNDISVNTDDAYNSTNLFNHLFGFIKQNDGKREIAKLIADYEKEHGDEKD